MRVGTNINTDEQTCWVCIYRYIDIHRESSYKGMDVDVHTETDTNRTTSTDFTHRHIQPDIDIQRQRVRYRCRRTYRPVIPRCAVSA